MYELLTFQRAFTTGNVAELVLKVISTDVPSIRERLPDADPELERIVATATRRDADQRYQSIDQLHSDLQRILARVDNDDPLTARIDVTAAVAPRQASAKAPDPDTGQMPNTIGAARPPSGAPLRRSWIIRCTSLSPFITRSKAEQPPVRVTVVQCDDARVVNQSFDVGESFEIGRESGNLRANDMSWSRRHAVIEYVNDGYAIRDLGSTGGTYVNGRRVRPNATESLLFGARITIGGSVLVFSPASDTRLPDLTGAVVADRYVLERLLRTSSKGAVYAARQQTIALRHALKLLSPTLLDYPGYRDRFKREAEVASELHHPHICEVQDYGEATITPPGKNAVHTAYLCLRLMTGGTLADRLDAREQISLPDVGRWIDSLGGALAYAHERNIVHGDIKPAAVVFDDGANAYLTDFAIGQPREGDSTPGVIGTPAYMAPEQWEGQPSTRATDQFGLAALAYYMVAGVRPFEGQDNQEIRRRNFEHGPLAAHKEATLHARSEVPPTVSEVLARGLAFKADDRYADLTEFAREFNEALSGRRDRQNAPATPRVFLSYQRAGGAGLSLFIVSQLEKHGIDVFLDVQRADGAVKFPERLIREIQGADVFVCLLGPETLGVSLGAPRNRARQQASQADDPGIPRRVRDPGHCRHGRDQRTALVRRHPPHGPSESLRAGRDRKAREADQRHGLAPAPAALRASKRR